MPTVAQGTIEYMPSWDLSNFWGNIVVREAEMIRETIFNTPVDEVEDLHSPSDSFEEPEHRHPSVLFLLLGPQGS